MIDYDPFDQEIIYGDPHRVYKRLREESPVHYLPRWDCWALARFEDVWDACMDGEAYTAARGTSTAHLLTKVQPVTPTLNTMDAPDHTRLRAELRKFFAPGRIRKLVPAFEGFVDEAIAEFDEAGACDAVADFAQVVATRVGCEVAGFPPEDAPHMRSLVEMFFDRDPEVEGMTEKGIEGLNGMFEYFAQLSAKRRTQPKRYDPIGILHEFEVGGAKLDDADIASHLFLLLVGGTDTFPKVFANLLMRLHQNPDIRAEVAAQPDLGLAAFNEAVRVDMPTQMMCRVLLKDHEVRGQQMREGQTVMFLYASANRDDREFDDPERYDIHRTPPRTLSFSHGTHACIGLHVARLEGQIALRKLLERYPDYEIETDGLERYATEFVQGYARMPTVWRT
ncbi:cytochrome P450 [Myxococcota bacterium]|nr:cytochrome P450 [Myxococcota bacterium]